MEALTRTGYAAAQCTVLGAVGFAAGVCAHALVKSAVSRVALGAMGIAFVGGAAAVQYAVRAVCSEARVRPLPETELYLQALTVGLYYAAVCTACVALGALNIPQAVIGMGLLSFYPVCLALLTYKTPHTSPVWNELQTIHYGPDNFFDFVIGREIRALFQSLRQAEQPQK